MAPENRRVVSFVIPSPATVDKLVLPPLGTPRNGQIGPLVHYARGQEHSNSGHAEHTFQTRHRLGVAAFALDVTTKLPRHVSPGGILYSGGRDGMILGWDLGVPTKRRARRYGFYDNRPRRTANWDSLTNWNDSDSVDDAIDEEDEEDYWPTSDGDVLGDVVESGGRRGLGFWTKRHEIPYEQQWETDITNFKAGQNSSLWKGIQAHADWVNDIILCNRNETVVSGSSDGSIKAWSPLAESPSPITIGTHSDYVRCLTQSSERNWIASGSFDRSIKLWDMAQSRDSPLVTLFPPEGPGPKSSVYAIAADPFGHVIASGGPERVIRTWDPRSGKRIGKLVGHTDNIRAILMSEDSRYILTGSADASIKLWSILSPQRCLHTFTHHTESVWSLFSSHPSLEIFYSGDRSGLLCKVDVEDCKRVVEGECAVICKDSGDPNIAASEGISKIIAMDDNLVWTATGSSSIRRWRVPQRRLVRATLSKEPDSPLLNSDVHFQGNSAGKPEISIIRSSSGAGDRDLARHNHRQSEVPSITTSMISSTSSLAQDAPDDDARLYGLPYSSLVKLTAPQGAHTSFGLSRGRDGDTATLYSAASVLSVPRQARGPTSPAIPNSQSFHNSTFNPRDTLSLPPGSAPFIFKNSPRMDYEEREVAIDAHPLNDSPDCVIKGEHGLVRAMTLNDRMHVLTVNTAGEVALWNIVRCQCLGMFTREDVLSANKSSSALEGSTPGEMQRCSPRQALEVVRERIEGEAVVSQWASAETKIGELTIELMDRCFEAEIFGDEAGYGPERQFSDEQRLNIGKWVLRNLFLGFIKEELHVAARQTQEKQQPSSYKGNQWGLASSQNPDSSDIASNLRSPGSSTPISTAGVLLDPANPRLGSLKLHNLSPIPQSPIRPDGTGDATPRPGHVSATPSLPLEHSNNTAGTIAIPAFLSTSMPSPKSMSTPVASATASSSNGTTNIPSVTTATSSTVTSSTNVGTSDYFSLKRRTSTAGQSTPDDFSGWGGPGSVKQRDASSTSSHDAGATSPTTPGGFIGRFKILSKGNRRSATDPETPSATVSVSTTAEESDNEVKMSQYQVAQPKTLIQKLKAYPLSPPTATEAPPLPISPSTTIIISEEALSGWSPVYRGSVGTVGEDMALLENVMPGWLLELLLINKTPSIPLSKVSFVLLPMPVRADAGDDEQLPELLNSSQSKLSASRFLRVRKLTHHVEEKLDKIAQVRNQQIASRSSSPTSRTSSDTYNRSATMSARDGESISRSSTPKLTSQGSMTQPPGLHNPPARSRAMTTSPSTSPAHSPSHSRSSPTLATHYQSQGVPPPLPSQAPLRGEDLYEIICNDQILPLDMTLAAVRQFVWRQSGELVMHYRKRRQNAKPTSHVSTPVTTAEPDSSSKVDRRHLPHFKAT